MKDTVLVNIAPKRLAGGANRSGAALV